MLYKVPYFQLPGIVRKAKIKEMKKINLLAVTVLFAIITKAQQFKFKPLDVSQADFAYFP